jgi:1,4-alpha-glucan branching enzyme
VVFASSSELSPASHTLAGMGATVIRDRTSQAIVGTFFKFWLPAVREVYVIGNFNNWGENSSNMFSYATEALRLTQLGRSGYWYGYTPAARSNDANKNEYKYFVVGIDGRSDDVADPIAKDTVGSVQNTVGSVPDVNEANARIVDGLNFDWQYDRYFAERRRDFRQFIIYEIHWGTFFRAENQSDYEKFGLDGTSDADKRFRVSKRLQKISNLGFTAIELMPIHEANGATDAGYNPSFFFAVESAYGTPEDLRILVDEAHKLGLAVIFDTVINHLTSVLGYSSFSQEFIRGWYSREDAPWSNHKVFPGQSDWGPDPDFDRQEIRNIIIDCIRMYFNEYHIDGIRFDATTTIPRSALKEIVGQLQLEYGWQGKYFIAEHLTDDPFPYIVGDIGCNAGWYKPAFDRGLQQAIAPPIRGSLAALRNLFETNYNGQPETAIKYVLGSHDEIWMQSDNSRAAINRVGGPASGFSRMKLRLAWALNVCALGVPMMFMGTEYMTERRWDSYNGYNATNADANRVSFVWEPNPSSAEGQFRLMVRDINQLRLNIGALRTANINCKLVHVDNDNGVCAYKRWDNFGNVILIVINISDGQWERREYQVNTDTPNSVWHEVFDSQYVNYGGWTGSGNADSSFFPRTDEAGLLQGINVPKWSLMVLKQQI